MHSGAKDVIVCDSKGAIDRSRSGLTSIKQWLAENTNPRGVSGGLAEALKGADVFIGVSAPDICTPEMLDSMANAPIVFAMSNPDPEISPEDAEGHVRVMATGRSDYPNQINNVLCFPGFFRGLLDCRASDVNNEMKDAAAMAIASVITDAELQEDYIIPSVFDRRVAPAVAKAVIEAAWKTGVSRREVKTLRGMGEDSDDEPAA
jgi:malate dehydrogenase (oxaloacetate-decarboxylating)